MQHADWVQGPNQYQQNQQANGTNVSTKDAQANGARKRRPRTVPASYTSTSGGSGKRASFSGTLPDGEYVFNDLHIFGIFRECLSIFDNNAILITFD
jgi:hypothetical protein